MTLVLMDMHDQWSQAPANIAVTHDIAYRVSAALADDRRLFIGSDVWMVHVAGLSCVGERCFLHIAVVGPDSRDVMVAIDPCEYRLTTHDVLEAVAVRLAGDVSTDWVDQ